ncbi:host attachment family protein [Pyruvatibacter sp.]|uniref:host attachment family protein n=1 Tax=Pyruvatibacter sp. TaxID=1981328 RepID=UPI003267C2B4
MKLPHSGWVIVADGAKMLLLENHGDETHLDLRIRSHDEVPSVPTHESGSERPGRTGAPSTRRAAFEQTDWHALEKDRFADTLAAKMNAWAHKGEMTHAVLVAAPRTLGELRTHLSDGARASLVAEIAADLAHQTIAAIEKAVDKA